MSQLAGDRKRKNISVRFNHHNIVIAIVDQRQTRIRDWYDIYGTLMIGESMHGRKGFWCHLPREIFQFSNILPIDRCVMQISSIFSRQIWCPAWHSRLDTMTFSRVNFKYILRVKGHVKREERCNLFLAKQTNGKRKREDGPFNSLHCNVFEDRTVLSSNSFTGYLEGERIKRIFDVWNFFFLSLWLTWFAFSVWEENEEKRADALDSSMGFFFPFEKSKRTSFCSLFLKWMSFHFSFSLRLE